MEDANAILGPAIQAHQGGRLTEAESLYQAVLRASPGQPVALYNLGMLRLSQGQLGSLADLRQALAARHPALDAQRAGHDVVVLLLQQQYKSHALQFLDWLDAQALVPHEAQALRQACALPSHLAPLSPAPPGAAALQRYHPMECSRYVYAIDIVGGCNLRCPTCPVGQGHALPKGLMDLPLFRRILGKAQREQHPHVPEVWLFNWGEPLLHPQVDEFIRAVRDAGMPSLVSTNLHHGERIDAVMQANPDRLKVSLSSLRQEVYGQTHERGDIERVKRHLQALAQARDRHRASTQIWIGHHLYKHTLEDQVEVSHLAKTLGFGYQPSVAIMAPIETALACVRSPGSAVHPLQAQLLQAPHELAARLQAQRSGRFDCELRFNMTALNHLGQISLCCATTQPLSTTPVHFLDLSHAQIEAHKYRHDFCRQCMDSQMHLTIPDL